MLLVHAGVADRRSWRGLIARLRDRHRCVAFDMRGFGETEYEAQDGFSPVDDALAVIDAAGLRRPVLVGSSFGGRVAVDIALTHPERVAGLALIGAGIAGAPRPDAPPPGEAELWERLDAAEQAGDLSEVNRLETWMWLDGPLCREGRVSGRPRELTLEMNGRALRAADPGESVELDPPSWERLEQLTMPVLMVCGRLDVSWIRATAESAAPRIPGARLQWLDGVAHLPHVEQDAATLDAITAFVDSPG